MYSIACTAYPAMQGVYYVLCRYSPPPTSNSSSPPFPSSSPFLMQGWASHHLSNMSKIDPTNFSRDSFSKSSRLGSSLCLCHIIVTTIMYWGFFCINPARAEASSSQVFNWRAGSSPGLMGPSQRSQGWTVKTLTGRAAWATLRIRYKTIQWRSSDQWKFYSSSLF